MGLTGAGISSFLLQSGVMKEGWQTAVV